MTLAPERTIEPLTVLGACHHDCPDTCAWEVTVVDGVATKMRGSATHPFTQGTLCPKVNRFLDRVYHPDRLLQPMRRTGPKGSGQFATISWDEAIEAIADRMRGLMDAGRADAVLQFASAGTQGMVQMGIVLDRLFDLVGASDIRGEICGATSRMGAADVLGVPLSADPESIRHARTIVLWGTNTRITNRHLWPFIEEARGRGAHVTVVDPVRTETARAANEHLQVRPGSDVALVLGLVHVLVRDRLLDPQANAFGLFEAALTRDADLSGLRGGELADLDSPEWVGAAPTDQFAERARELLRGVFGLGDKPVDSLYWLRILSTGLTWFAAIMAIQLPSLMLDGKLYPILLDMQPEEKTKEALSVRRAAHEESFEGVARLYERWIGQLLLSRVQDDWAGVQPTIGSVRQYLADTQRDCCRFG